MPNNGARRIEKLEQVLGKPGQHPGASLEPFTWVDLVTMASLQEKGEAVPSTVVARYDYAFNVDPDSKWPELLEWAGQPVASATKRVGGLDKRLGRTQRATGTLRVEARVQVPGAKR